MNDILQAWEEALLLGFNGTPEIAAPMVWWITQPWCSIPVYLFIIWRLFRNVPWRVGAVRLGVVLLTFAGTDAVSSRLMKPGFERLRPSHEPRLAGQLVLHLDAAGEPYRGGRFGFVSSHAANTFGLAAATFLILGGSGLLWLWFWAGLVSWTRLYLGVHYTGDIVCGALFGAGWAVAIHTLATRLKLLPQAGVSKPDDPTPLP